MLNFIINRINARSTRAQGWDKVLVERRNPDVYAYSYSAPGYGWHEGRLEQVREHEHAWEIHRKIGNNEFIRKDDPNFRFTRIDG